MARTRKTVSEATRTTAAAPNFSVSGGGVGFEHFSNAIPELSGRDLLRDMYLMAETDETVGAMFYCIASTMRQIKWDYVPQIDGVDMPEDVEAQKWSALATTMLKDMSRPFDDHVEDSLSMLWAGFAPIEMVMKQRDGENSRYNDGYYGIKQLNLIDQTTVWDWIYEDNEPVAMKQMGFGVPAGSANGIVPLVKTLLYRTSTQYNNPRGRPLLKNAWRVWRLKRKIQDSEAIGIERELVGLPIFEMPMEDIEAQFETDADGNLTDDAKRAAALVTAATRATQDLRLNRSGGVVHPSNIWGEDVDGAGGAEKKYNFRILTTAGQRSIDSRTAARDYDHAIARVAMMQFLTLGQRSGGSYSLSDDQSSMAVAAIMALADKITAEWNARCVSLIWTVNMFPDKYRPRLKHSEVNKNGIVQLGQFLAGVGKAADLWGGDPKMRRGIAMAANLPYDSEAQEEAAQSHQKKAATEAEPQPAPVAAPVAKAAEDEEDEED